MQNVDSVTALEPPFQIIAASLVSDCLSWVICTLHIKSLISRRKQLHSSSEDDLGAIFHALPINSVHTQQ